jgi:hypothetical protein
MRKVLAWGMALALGGSIPVSAVVACPFVQASLWAAAHPCCPKPYAPASCPLSKSLETCPLYVAESKIGLTQTTVQIEGVLAPALLVPQVPDPGAASLLGKDRIPEMAGLHLRYCILRI